MPVDTVVSKRIIFCGGAFCFDCREDDYKIKASGDYRAILLDDVETLLRPEDETGVRISDCVEYVGPFYFETDTMVAEDIIGKEKSMIEACTDAVFLLDTADCPGTIAEVMYANSLHKRLHLFYVRRKDSAETESDLHSPCWYPLLFCKSTNVEAHLYSCADYDDAVQAIQRLVESLSRSEVNG